MSSPTVSRRPQMLRWLLGSQPTAVVDEQLEHELVPSIAGNRPDDARAKALTRSLHAPIEIETSI